MVEENSQKPHDFFELFDDREWHVVRTGRLFIWPQAITFGSS